MGSCSAWTTYSDVNEEDVEEVEARLRRQGKGIKAEKKEQWLSLCMLSLLLRARVGFACLFRGLGRMR